MNHDSPNHPRWSVWFFLLTAIIAPPTLITTIILPTIKANLLLALLFFAGYEGLVLVVTSLVAYLYKIWEHRADTWANASATRLEATFYLLFSGARQRYLRFFVYEHRDLDMKGISARGTYSVSLEQVFVDIRLDPTPLPQLSTDPVRIPSELRTGSHTAWDYLAGLDQHLAVIGAPGSGKTTLLKHLGLTLANHYFQRRKHSEYPQKLRWTIPFFLPLREHSSAIRDRQEYGLVEAISKHIGSWKQDISNTWIERVLCKGQCLILLDGLDEVGDEELRKWLAVWVNQEMLAYPENRFIVTSRPLGYYNNPLEHVTVLETQPFRFEQISRFLHSWYLANEIKRSVRDDPGIRKKAYGDAEDLLGRLGASSVLSTLAVNPLLLTMIATVHLYYGTLPGARITLYKAICEVFLSRRQPVLQELRAEQCQSVLQVLAYEMMKQKKRELARQEVCEIIKAPLQSVSTALNPELFLRHLETISSSLLLEREAGMYSFAHQTFQEYLAMLYIQEQHLERELLAHVKESWWHETILLSSAQADATAILEACLTASERSLEALVLAIDCAQEARTVQAAVKDRLNTLLEQGGQDPDPARQRIVAEAMLRRRLRQMSPMGEGRYVDMSLLTCAEYKLFLDELNSPWKFVPDVWSTSAVLGKRWRRVFPPDQWKAPALGIRFECAETFCRWLTDRNTEGWLYRLPRQAEREQITAAIGTVLMEATAYWEEGENVIWSHDGPSASIFQMILSSLNPGVSEAEISDFAGDFVRNRVRISDLSKDLDLKLASVRNRANSHAHDLLFDLNHTSGHASALHRNLVLRRNRVSDHDLTLVRDLCLELDRDLELARTSASIRSTDSSYYCDLANDLASARPLAFKLYLLLFLFIRRPANAQPAYEGILLVKERHPLGNQRAIDQRNTI